MQRENQPTVTHQTAPAQPPPSHSPGPPRSGAVAHLGGRPTLLYTTAQAARHATEWRQFGTGTPATVTPAAVRKWASRGHLDPAGLDDQGHPLYDLADIARAEKATRRRALRLVDAATP